MLPRDVDRVARALELDWEGGVPATFVYDRTGKLRKTWMEELTYAELAAPVARLLSEARTRAEPPSQ